MVDPETLAAGVFLLSPAVLAAVTMWLLNRRIGWLAITVTSLVALGLAFPVGFTFLGALGAAPLAILFGLIVFGMFVGMIGHLMTRRLHRG